MQLLAGIITRLNFGLSWRFPEKQVAEWKSRLELHEPLSAFVFIGVLWLRGQWHAAAAVGSWCSHGWHETLDFQWLLHPIILLPFAFPQEHHRMHHSAVGNLVGVIGPRGMWHSCHTTYIASQGSTFRDSGISLFPGTDSGISLFPGQGCRTCTSSITLASSFQVLSWPDAKRFNLTSHIMWCSVSSLLSI